MKLQWLSHKKEDFTRFTLEIWVMLYVIRTVLSCTDIKETPKFLYASSLNHFPKSETVVMEDIYYIMLGVHTQLLQLSAEGY